MDWSRFVSQLTVRVLIGAALGLLVGLLLVAVDTIDNPFWVMSGGIMLAAVTTVGSTTRG